MPPTDPDLVRVQTLAGMRLPSMARCAALLMLAFTLLATLTGAHPPHSDGDGPCFNPANGAEIPWSTP